MKKLLLLFILFLSSFTINAQDNKTQFYKDYNSVRITDTTQSDTGWKSIECRVYFNYGNDSSKIKIYLNNVVFNLTQLSPTQSGTMEGYRYYKMDLTNDDTTESVSLYYFENQMVVIVDRLGQTIELNP